MFNIVIADDESKICALLEKSIAWEELGLKLAATCSTGPALLEAVETCRPDIVITDIQMPGLNGIDAIRSIRESNNNCKVIIISGYQEFSYARNALKYNVDDYLLKPIDAAELNASLRKITLELISRTDKAGAAVTAEPPDLREHFLSIFLPALTQQGYESLEAVNAGYGTAFREGGFIGIYLYIDTGREGHEVRSLDSLLCKVRDVCRTMLAPLCHELLFSEYGNGLLVGLNYPDAAAVSHQLQQLFDRVHPVVELFAGFGLTIGVGEATDDFSQFDRSVRHAVDIIRYRCAIGRNRLITWDSLRGKLELIQVNKDLKSFVVPVERSFDTCSAPAFQSAYDAFLGSGGSSQPLVQLLFVEKVAEAFGAFLDGSLPQYEKAAFIKSQLEFELQHALSASELWDSVRTSVSETLSDLNQLLREKENLPIRQAKEYIYKNYSRPIRLEDIASAVYLSPAYLSNIFKKVTGENLVNFINEYRVQQAKKLLVSTNMTVEEIAGTVGFDSHRYFGNVFRKTVGIKPSEYRKLYQ